MKISSNVFDITAENIVWLTVANAGGYQYQNRKVLKERLIAIEVDQKKNFVRRIKFYDASFTRQPKVCEKK